MKLKCKVCLNCGNGFEGGHYNRLYCDTCRILVYAKQRKEGNLRYREKHKQIRFCKRCGNVLKPPRHYCDTCKIIIVKKQRSSYYQKKRKPRFCQNQNCGNELTGHQKRWCKKCSKEKIKEYQEEYKKRPSMKEKGRLAGLKYYKKNKEKMLKWHRETYVGGSIAGKGFHVYTNGYAKELRPMVDDIKNKVLEDAIANPRKFLGKYIEPKGKIGVYKKERLHEK